MENQEKVLNLLGTYSNVPNKVLNDLTEKMNMCIGSAIHDAILNKEQTALLDIGIGSLSVSLATMQCKFIPSKHLKAAIKNAIDDKIDPVELKLEKTLINKLIKICDEEL